jgi:hypothetical protein
MVKARSHIARMAGWRETNTLKPIDNITNRVMASCQAATKVNAEVASKVRSPEGRDFNRRTKAAWIPENWLMRVVHFGGVRAAA